MKLSAWVGLAFLLSGSGLAATGKDLVTLVSKAGYVHQDCYEINGTDGVHCGQFKTTTAITQANFSKAATKLGWKQVGKWQLMDGSKERPYARFKKGPDTILIQLNDAGSKTWSGWFKIDWAN